MLDFAFLNQVRRHEIQEVLQLLRPGSRVLEFGSGTGEQARFLSTKGFDVIALDLPTSEYATERLYPVREYDGRNIPLEDASVDIIFSSNVLEHIENFDAISAEFRRVLKPGGYAVHVLPTSVWRFWHFVTALTDSCKAAIELPARLLKPPPNQPRKHVLIRGIRHIGSGFLPRAHGTSREGVSELWSFSRVAWRRKFRRSGFEIASEQPIGLFYTGTMLFGATLPLEKRARLSRLLGSSTRVYVVRPAHENGA